MTLDELIKELCKLRAELPGNTRVTIFNNPISHVYAVKHPSQKGIKWRKKGNRFCDCELDELIWSLINCSFDIGIELSDNVYVALFKTPLPIKVTVKKVKVSDELRIIISF